MRIKVFRVARKSVLSPKLCELAGPVGQHQGAAFISQRGIGGAVGIIKASTKEPAACELVIRRSIEAEGALEPRRRVRRTGKGQADQQGGLVLLPPDELAARYKRTINGALQRLPAPSRVHAVKICNEGAAELVMAARIGGANIHVGVVSDVFVSAQVADDAQVVFVGRLEHIAGVATEALPGELQEPVPGSGNDVLDRDSGIVNAVFTTYKVL